MRHVYTLLILAAATLASTYEVCLNIAAQIPYCGVSCLSNAASTVGCDQDDLACQCSQSSSILNSALDCIVTNCGAVTGLEVWSSAQAVCSCVAGSITTSAMPVLLPVGAPGTVIPLGPTTPTGPETPTSTTTSLAPTQHCHCHYHFFWNAYSVQIGVPYGGSSDCDATYHALYNLWVGISGWQCVPTSDGDIQLWFNAYPYRNDDINGVLESRYPTIIGGFNCPPA